MSDPLAAKKSLGQHFLKSQAALRAMVQAPSLQEGDCVIEIGPGKGVLTQTLLDAGAHVIAFELDPRMMDFLAEKFSQEIDEGRLELVHMDVLDVQLENYVKGRSYKLIANIPYYITNLIIRKFLETQHQASDICLLVQKEVAERIVARDGKQSLLSLSVSAYADVRFVMKVAKQYFSPPPKVDSAIIHMSNISHHRFASMKEEREFFRLLHIAFAHKRKQLQANLKPHYDAVEIARVLNTLLLPQTVRAEDISLPQWIELFHLLKS